MCNILEKAPANAVLGSQICERQTKKVILPHILKTRPLAADTFIYISFSSKKESTQTNL